MKPEDTIIGLTLAFVYLSVNFSFNLAMVYIGMLFLGYILLKADSKVTIKIGHGRNLEMILVGVITYVLFIVASTVVLSVLKLPATLNSVYSAMAASVPVFQGNAFFNFITFGIFIAATETIVLFGHLPEWISNRFFKTEPAPRNIANLGLWITKILTVLLFVAIHFTVKGIHNIPALTLVGVMALFSMITITLWEDLRPAIYFHILANSIAMLASLGLLGVLGGII